MKNYKITDAIWLVSILSSFLEKHCTVRKNHIKISGHAKQFPDSPDKFWTVDNPNHMRKNWSASRSKLKFKIDIIKRWWLWWNEEYVVIIFSCFYYFPILPQCHAKIIFSNAISANMLQDPPIQLSEIQWPWSRLTPCSKKWGSSDPADPVVPTPLRY